MTAALILGICFLFAVPLFLLARLLRVAFDDLRANHQQVKNDNRALMEALAHARGERLQFQTEAPPESLPYRQFKTAEDAKEYFARHNRMAPYWQPKAES